MVDLAGDRGVGWEKAEIVQSRVGAADEMNMASDWVVQGDGAASCPPLQRDTTRVSAMRVWTKRKLVE